MHAATGQVEEVARHGDRVYSVAWSPCGAKIATGDKDCCLRIVDVATMHVDQVVKHGGGRWSFAWLVSVVWIPSSAKVAQISQIF